MSTLLAIPDDELVEIPSPHVEPRLAFLAQEPRKANNLTLIDGKTFLSTTVAGDIVPSGAPDVGLFHDDTRFLSHLELRVSGHRAVVLSPAPKKPLFRKSNSPPEISPCEILLNSHKTRSTSGGSSCSTPRDSLTVLRLRTQPKPGRSVCRVLLRCRLCGRVPGARHARQVHGQYYRPVRREHCLAFFYRGLDGVLRQTLIEMKPEPSEIRGTNARWALRLAPLKQIEIEVTVTPFVQRCSSRSTTCDYSTSLRERRDRYKEWESQGTRFKSNHGIFDAVLNTAISDFHALQVLDGDQRIIAAGVPWFATIFGRDSIIAAYQALPLNPQLAIDTLRVLARYQGKNYDDWRDEEPEADTSIARAR